MNFLVDGIVLFLMIKKQIQSEARQCHTNPAANMGLVPVSGFNVASLPRSDGDAGECTEHLL